MTEEKKEETAAAVHDDDLDIDILVNTKRPAAPVHTQKEPLPADPADTRETGETPKDDTVPTEPPSEGRLSHKDFAHSQTAGEKRASVLLSPTFTVPLFMLFVCALILMTDRISFSGTGVDVYLSSAALQLIVFMLPSVFYIRYRSTDVRERVRIRLPAPDKIMFIVLCSMILMVLSMTMSALGGVFGSVYEKGYSYDLSAESGSVLYYAVCFALIPALCEELMFRGIIMSELQSASVPAAVILNSLFFSMIHFDLGALPFCFLSGLVLSMCAYASNSIIASFAAHLLYNLFAIFGGEIVDKVTRMTTAPEMIAAVLGALLLFLLVLTFGECRRIYYSYAKRNRDSSYVPKHKKGSGAVRFASVMLSPGAIAAAVLFIAAALLKK